MESVERLAHSAPSPTETKLPFHHTANVHGPNILPTVPAAEHGSTSDNVYPISPQWEFMYHLIIKKSTTTKTHLMSLHNLCQSVWFILWRKRWKVNFLFLQRLIIQPQSKHTKQPADNQSSVIRKHANKLLSGSNCHQEQEEVP